MINHMIVNFPETERTYQSRWVVFVSEKGAYIQHYNDLSSEILSTFSIASNLSYEKCIEHIFASATAWFGGKLPGYQVYCPLPQIKG